MAHESPSDKTQENKIWYLLGGILATVVGFSALLVPLYASLALEVLIGAFCLVTGAFDLGAAIMGKFKVNQWRSAVFAFLRLVAGAILLAFPGPGLLAVNAVLGLMFIFEGIFGIYAGVKMRHTQPYWGFLILSSGLALALGLIVFLQWPFSGAWMPGIVYGINLVFSGGALLSLALGGK